MSCHTYLLTALLLTGCAQSSSYKNSALSPDQRADLLLKELTLEEKVSLMMDSSQPVERLDIKPYNWWNEALHGVARAGLATVFPQPIGMAASFDPDLLEQVFTAVSDEARAKNTRYAAEGEYQRYQGLTFWTPTVNIFRDPRWGRGIETYGEDPYLTARMGVQVVKGLQGTNDGRYDKLHACAKHFAVHSGPEWNRHQFNAENIVPRELHETYLYPFEALVKEGGVQEVMCAYNRLEGDPCCGSDRLLTQILRNDWGYQGIILSDCGAIDDFYREGRHGTHADAASASAAAVLSGTDLECGSSYKALMQAVAEGKIKESDIDVSIHRLLRARFALGEMDDPAEVSWTRIPYSTVASQEHNDLSLEMARRSLVLLQNNDHILPLKKGGLTVAVMGPNANDSVMQWGNYNGTPLHTITILEGIRRALGSDDRLIYEPGCSWVERTLPQSAFDRCQSAEGKGFHATYWNNTERSGEPVATDQITTPFRFCTSGATVFAPGVNLTDFSATYRSTYMPDRTGEIEMEIYAYGSGCLRINGEEVRKFRNRHGGKKSTYTQAVQAGKPVEIELDFEYLQGDAQLNFDLGFKQEVDIAGSVAAVKEADIVVFVSGISPSLEGEEMGVKLPGFRGGDRTDIELPAVQRELIAALARAGKRIVLVNCSGSPIGLEPETHNCQAILQAWYPGQAGGQAVAEALFGSYNPGGRLPVTFYCNTAQLPDFEDYNMKGRTYRYLQEKPLFPFGYGLSYTTFRYGEVKAERNDLKCGEPLKLTVPLSNTGTVDGDEVVQVYLRREGDTDGPIKALRGFSRVHLAAGESRTVSVEIAPKALEWWDNESNTMRPLAGRYEVMVGGDSQDESLQRMWITIDN